MSETFETHLAAGEKALEDRDYDVAAPAFRSALAAAENGLERALALIGLAQPDCYGENRARALKLLEEARACLPPLEPPEPRLAEAYARICLKKTHCLMGLRQYALCIQELDLAIDRFLDFASMPEPLAFFARQLRETMTELLQMKAGLITSVWPTGEPFAAYNASIACYDEMIRRFETVTDPTIARRVARARLVRAWQLPHAGRAAEEMAAYDEIVARYGDRTEESYVDIVTSALERQIEIHEKNDDPANALVAAEEILRRAEGQKDFMVVHRAVRARLSKAYALIGLDRMDESRALCNQIITELSGDRISRADTADALLLKADTYPETEIACVIACYDRVISDYEDDTDWSVVRRVCRAWFIKGQVLRDASREDEAVECLKAMIGEYGGHRDPSIKGMIEEARRMLTDGPAITH